MKLFGEDADKAEESLKEVVEASPKLSETPLLYLYQPNNSIDNNLNPDLNPEPGWRSIKMVPVSLK